MLLKKNFCSSVLAACPSAAWGQKNKLASLELRSTSVAKGYGFLLRQANKFLDKPSGKAERERASHARESRKSTESQGQVFDS